MAINRSRIIWLIIPCVLLVATIGVGIWYCLPYFQGEAEYSSLREYAPPLPEGDGGGDGEAAAEGGAAPQQVAGETGGDPYMHRDIDWAGLAEINPDIIGWIWVPNTSVDYPLVQAPVDDPEKYLHTTFEGAVSWPNNQGCIYLDSSNIEDGLSSTAPLIYGHYQNNGSMLTPLTHNCDLETLHEQENIYIYTPTGTIHLQCFAGNLVNSDTERIRTDFIDADDLRSWMDGKLAESEAVSYDPGTIPQLFTLCTCNFSGVYRHARTLTYAQVVEDTRPEAVKVESVDVGEVVQQNAVETDGDMSAMDNEADAGVAGVDMTGGADALGLSEDTEVQQ